MNTVHKAVTLEILRTFLMQMKMLVELCETRDLIRTDLNPSHVNQDNKNHYVKTPFEFIGTVAL